MVDKNLVERLGLTCSSCRQEINLVKLPSTEWKRNREVKRINLCFLLFFVGFFYFFLVFPFSVASFLW